MKPTQKNTTPQEQTPSHENEGASSATKNWAGELTVPSWSERISASFRNLQDCSRTFVERLRIVGKDPTTVGVFDHRFNPDECLTFFTYGINTDEALATSLKTLVEQSYELQDEMLMIANENSENFHTDVVKAGMTLASASLGAIIEPRVKDIQDLTLKSLCESDKELFFFGFSEGAANLLAAWDLMDWYFHTKESLYSKKRLTTPIDQIAMIRCLSPEAKALHRGLGTPVEALEWWNKSKERIIAHFYGINLNHTIEGVRTEVVYSDNTDIVPVASGILGGVNRLTKSLARPGRRYSPAVVHEIPYIKPEGMKNLWELTLDAHSLDGLLRGRPLLPVHNS